MRRQNKSCENSWTGGSAGGNLSDPNNWSSGVVPTHAIIKVDSEAVFTKNDGDDSISSITIEAGSAAVTIKGARARVSSATNGIFAIARDGCLSGLQRGS